MKVLMTVLCVGGVFSTVMAGNHTAAIWAFNCLIWVGISAIEQRT